MSKRLGGIKGAANTIPLHGIQTGSPMQITLGPQYNVGEKPTVILYIYILIAMQGHQKNIRKNRDNVVHHHTW